MALILTILLSIFALFLLIQAVFFALEVTLGVRSFRSAVASAPSTDMDSMAEAGTRPRLAILVPAHNEAGLIKRAVDSLSGQLAAGDRVLVIADNCDDDTAAIARAAGAEVCERAHESDRGKGYALDFGLNYLAADPPELIIMMDADCVAEHGCIEALARAAQKTGRPVQGLYRMNPPQSASVSNASAGDGLGLFAWRVRVELRLRGARALGTPASLMGSGMAFPWDLIRSIDLANGDLVEDLRSAVDLVESGVYPLFIPDAVVFSEQPAQESARDSQRERWIQGHLATLFTRVPGLFMSSIKKRDLNQFVMCLEIMVLPIGLLGLCLGVGLLLALFLGWLSSYWFAFYLFFAGLLFTVGAVLIAWFFAGRDLVSANALAQFVLRTLKRIPLYAGVILKRQAKWVRTERD